MQTKKRSELAVILLLALSQPGAGALTPYEAGIKEYNSGNYKSAADAFSKAARNEPGKQLYHYLLANCLVHMDEHEKAAEEYKKAYLIDSGNSTGLFSKQALLAYKKPIPRKADGSAELERVKTLIEKQTNFEKDKHDSMASRSQQSIRSQLEERLRFIDQQMEADIQKLHEPIVYTPGPQANRLLAMPELLKEREEQIRRSAVAEKERLVREADDRSKPYDAWRKDRAALLDEAASNLKTQLEQPTGPSGVKLQTQGTGLYVRYYGKPAESHLPETRPATCRIREAGSQTEAELAKERAADMARTLRNGSESEVKGRLIKKESDIYFVQKSAGNS